MAQISLDGMQNPSFLMRKANDTAIEDKAIPEVSEHNVLVAVQKTGVCATDVHFLVEGHVGPIAVEKPMVLGHESSGIVTKVGSKVTHLKPGDRVTIEPGEPCRRCEYCMSGTYQRCQSMPFAATPPTDGTLTKYYQMPADFAYPVPDSMSLEDAAMMEPLAVAVHAISTLGKFRSGQSIAVLGCGPIGLLCMAAAKAMGAERIIGVDISPPRLAFAKEYIATDVWKPVPPEEGDQGMAYAFRNSTAMKEALGFGDVGPGSIDLVVDATGVASSIETGPFIAKYGGGFVLIGLGAMDTRISWAMVLLKEMAVTGSFRYGGGDFRQAISLASTGKVNLKPLVTHRYKFEDAALAFETAKHGKSEDGKLAIKVMVSGPGVSLDKTS